MNSSLVNSLAKVYDPKPLHGQKPGGKRLSSAGLDKAPSSSCSSAWPDGDLHCVETRMDSLSSQMDQLLSLQETVLTRLDGLTRDLGGVRREVAKLREGGRGGGEAGAAGRELQGVVLEASERVEQQGCRLEGVERLVESMQQIINFVGDVVKNSRLVEMLFKKPKGRVSKASRKVKDFRGKDGKDKSNLNAKGLKTQKKRSPPDSTDSAPLRETLLQDQVEKLNRENTERSHGDPEAEEVGVDGGGGGRAELQELILGEQCVPVVPSLVGEEEKEEQEEVFRDSESELEEEKEEGELKVKKPPGEVEEVEEKKRRGGEGEEGAVTSEQQVLEPAVDIPTQNSESILPSLESSEVAASSKRRVTEEEVKDDLKKSRVEEEEKEVEEKGVEEEERGRVPEGEEPDTAQSHSLESEEVKEDGESSVKEYMIDSSPPPSAPFEHRIVIPKPHQIATFYSINREEVLGGGRFGQVHKCVENSSGLTLAAKIIKGRSLKEKEVVKNEIQVMNQLNHANLIQLYAAFESRHDIILVMEYVDGGELFDRIIDENYNLTELDTVLFIRQISEGLQYMHKMYILHLDLKPENILCVSRVTNKIKIIDFGLARRYKPREKLRVNFGTPEFLAPEVINYEFVSFPTDMWSLGVITYMLLSGLSPFLGDDDNETLNNILACQWNFEEEEFTEISEEAKDFITRLLIKSKSWRMSAAESLRHPWLSDHSLHYRLHQKKNKCHSTHAPPPES